MLVKRLRLPIQQYPAIEKVRSIGALDAGTVEPVYNGHLGTRYTWPLYTGGCYRENLYKVVSSILVAMAVMNE